MAKIKLNEDTRYAIRGRIATMDSAGTVFKDGVIYIKGNSIVAVKDKSEPAPEGFRKSKTRKYSGTIYPGMIELHNHLSYNVLPMWDVPKTFQDRDQWRRHSDYQKKMTGPLKVLGSIDGYLQSIVRYVECKLLFAGVTASQGITLASHGGITKFYKGTVRNVEQSISDDLISARTRIADIKDAEKLRKVLDNPKTNCYLLHLAEGVHARANKHFKALQVDAQDWAIRKNLAGIHALGLLPEDFKIMGEYNGSMVWSPMSNLLLYGTTADIRSAKEAGVRISLGSDWSASGSKNLLSELKVAKIISDELGDEDGGVFTNEELVRMVTSVPANMLQWDSKIGSLEAGKKADFVILKGKKNKDVYDQYIQATEKDIQFVVIDGIPRLGYRKSLMSEYEIDLERIKFKGYSRYMNVTTDNEQHPISVNLLYKDAKKMLKKGMKDLPKLTKRYEDNKNAGSMFAMGAVGDSVPGDGGGSSQWVIAEDHSNCQYGCQRLHLEYEGMLTGGTDVDDAAVVLSEIIEPIKLDESTIFEEKLYFKKLALQPNLPQYVKLKLPPYYGMKVDLNDQESYKEEVKQAIGKNFNFIQSLSKFYSTPGYLNLNDRITIIEQAEVLFKYAYVNLPQKEAMYASNPIALLRVMKEDMMSGKEYLTEIAFHRKLISIFNSVRDLHTVYSLPAPFQDKIAFLPFFIEEYYEGTERKFAVSKFIGTKSPSKYFEEGVEATHWNGVPIEKAIKKNGENYSGSNDTARFVRGLDAMTFRPLITMLPPEEEWVVLSYIAKDGSKRSSKFNWLVGSVYSKIVQTIKEEKRESQNISYGYDYMTLVVHTVKKFFFAPRIFNSELKNKEGTVNLAPTSAYLKTSFPGNFKAKVIKNTNTGYIRIYSFSTREPKEFALEFKRLLKELGTTKIIIDVRNNGGGNILAAEYLLQVLSTQRIKPQRSTFLINPLIEYLCKLHSPSKNMIGLDLSPWYDSLLNIKKTGANYTLGHSITSEKELRQFKASRELDLVLITDALCYSATDIFAAGFKDHDLGKILGIHDNTGAGGANVWTHSLLRMLTEDNNRRSPFFSKLPHGADFRIAIRRTLRVNKNEGIPVEDLGIIPDELHNMTKNDLMKGNIDLINHAIKLFESKDVVGGIPAEKKIAFSKSAPTRKKRTTKKPRKV